MCDEGLKPGNNKLVAIHSFPEATNVQEVRRFLGLSGFFRLYKDIQ